MKPKTITAAFTTFNFESNWVSGIVGDYTFEAKLFDDPSDFGINKGRVSKLSITNKDWKGILDWGNTVVNYDRGWDIRPTKEVKPYYKAVMNLLENSPRRFDLHDQKTLN